jgi:DNA-binding ferritin-like protein (Dps family)
MANYFNLILDTTGVSNSTVTIESGATYATNQLVNLTIGCSDGATAGYQMKIWGDVDLAYDVNIKATEGASTWITYATSKQIKLLTGDGSKTINVKIRDDVYNEGSIVSDSIILDTSLPVVTVTAVDNQKISRITGKDVFSFTFSCSEVFVEYKVKVVATSGAGESTGTAIGVASGSTNMSGTAGNYPASTPISCTITGTDLQTASSGDANKIIKVFVKDTSGLWSV